MERNASGRQDQGGAETSTGARVRTFSSVFTNLDEGLMHVTKAGSHYLEEHRKAKAAGWWEDGGGKERREIAQRSF